MPEIANAIGTATLQVTSTSPQIILTTPSADYDGSPVKITFSADYVNFLPDQNQSSNGIRFVLYEDGSPLSALGFYGSHGYGSGYRFGPIELTDVLDGARTPTEGEHTFSVAVFKWASGSDGYLVANDGQAARSKPMRLSVNRYD